MSHVETSDKDVLSTFCDVHDPLRPEQGEAVVYGVMAAADPEVVLYVGATAQHPAVRISVNRALRAAVPEPRYRVLEVCAAAEMPRREREWILKLRPPLNGNLGGGGRGMKADVARIRKLYAAGLSGRAIAAELGIHHATVLRHVPVADRREPGPKSA